MGKTDLNIIATANHINAFAEKYNVAEIEDAFSSADTAIFRSFSNFGKNRDKGMLLFLVQQTTSYNQDTDVVKAIKKLDCLLNPDKKKSLRENLDQMVDVGTQLQRISDWLTEQESSLSEESFALSKAIYIFSKNMTISMEKGIKKVNESYLMKQVINRDDQTNMGNLLKLSNQLAEKSKEIVISLKFPMSPVVTPLVASFQTSYEAHHQQNTTAIKFCHQTEVNLGKLILLKKTLISCQSEKLASLMGIYPKNKDKQAVFGACLKLFDPKTNDQWVSRYKEMKKEDFDTPKLFSLSNPFKEKKLNVADFALALQTEINHLCKNMASNTAQKELLINASINELSDLKDKASLLRLANTLDKVQQMIDQVVTRDNTWVGRLKIILSRIKHFGFCTPREKLANLAAQYNHSLSGLNIQSLNESAQKEVLQLLNKTQVLLDSTDKPLKEALITNFTVFKGRLDTLTATAIAPLSETKPSLSR